MKKLWMMGEGLPGPDGALEEQQILFSIVLIGIRAKIFLITHYLFHIIKKHLKCRDA